MDPKNGYAYIVGFFYGEGCSKGGGNWGTPKKDWGTLGNIGED